MLFKPVGRGNAAAVKFHGVRQAGRLLIPVIVKFIATSVVILSEAKNLAVGRPQSEIPFGLAQGRLRRGSRPLLRMTPMNVIFSGINNQDYFICCRRARYDRSRKS
jgi:hypothetical protein